MENSFEIQEDRPEDLKKSTQTLNMSTSITWQSIQITFNVVNHILIAFVSLYMTYIAYSNGNSAISWHVFLCTIGVSYLKHLIFSTCSNLFSNGKNAYLVSTFNGRSDYDILFAKFMVE